MKELWDNIQKQEAELQAKMAKGIESCIQEARETIYSYGESKRSILSESECVTIANGILAIGQKYNLDITLPSVRLKAVNRLLESVNWFALSDYKIQHASLRTRQLSEDFNVTSELVASFLYHLSGGASVSLGGGGGSDNKLTNWDGTTKRNGWGR